MEAAVKAVRPGGSELEVLAEAEYAMLKAGSWGSSFRPQVVSGERTLIAHPTASGKKIDSGEAVVIHLGSTCEGYCAKMCRTVALGEIPRKQEEVYDLLLQAQEEAIAALRPGATSAAVDTADQYRRGRCSRVANRRCKGCTGSRPWGASPPLAGRDRKRRPIPASWSASRAG